MDILSIIAFVYGAFLGMALTLVTIGLLFAVTGRRRHPARAGEGLRAAPVDEPPGLGPRGPSERATGGAGRAL